MTAAPTPRELEERAARAIHRTFPAADSDPWDAAVARYKAYGLPGNPPHVARALSAAEAALAVVREALAEPSDKMVTAAWKVAHCDRPTARACLRAALSVSPLRAGS